MSLPSWQAMYLEEKRKVRLYEQTIAYIKVTLVMLEPDDEYKVKAIGDELDRLQSKLEVHDGNRESTNRI